MWVILVLVLCISIECGSSSSWFYVNVGHPHLGFMYQYRMWVILVLVSCECGSSSSWFHVNVGHSRLGFMYQHRMWVILVLVSCESIHFREHLRHKRFSHFHPSDLDLCLLLVPHFPNTQGQLSLGPLLYVLLAYTCRHKNTTLC